MNPEQMQQQWERYAKAWSPVSDTERRDLLTQSLAPDFHYIDPRIECRGQKEVIPNLEAFQQRQPGGRFALRSILAHHDSALVNWQLIREDGAAANLGFDFIRFDSSGKMQEITGFFVPPSAPTPA